MATRQWADLNFGNDTRINSLPPAVATGQPVVFEQLNSAIQGLGWKDNVRVSTQANINLASPGATIDGITMAASDRVLVRSQTTTTENGLYLWNGAASAMTRAPDAATFNDLESAVVTVDEGTSAGATFRQSAVNGTIGSTAVVWTSFGTSAASASETVAGIAELATQAETDTGTDDLRIVTPLKLATWSGRPKRYSTTFGDNSATQFTITHNLNTSDVQVQVRRAAGNQDYVNCDMRVLTVNTVRLDFASAPTASELRVTVLA